MAQTRNWRYVSLSYAHGARVTRQTAEEGVGRDKKRNRQLSNYHNGGFQLWGMIEQ